MIIIMLGAPGTGKGTVSGMLSKELNIPQISTGDIFRKNMKEKTPLGLAVEEFMNKGILVPDEITVKIVEERIKEEDAKNGFILDGFPRTIAQAEFLDEILLKNSNKVDLVINLITPEEEIIERTSNRIVCSNQDCKTVYNLILNPPKKEGICNKCGSALIKRADDEEETVRHRLKLYFEQTSPLIDYYKNKNVLYVAEVSKAINKLGEDVVKDIIQYIKEEKV